MLITYETWQVNNGYPRPLRTGEAMGKILVLLGPLTLYWHGLESFKKLGHKVITHDMMENGSIEAIIDVVDAEKPDLVAIDGCFPLRAAAIGKDLIGRGTKCIPVLLVKDIEKRRRKTRDGRIEFVNRPIVDMLVEAYGHNSSNDLDAFDKRGEISNLQSVLERVLSPSVSVVEDTTKHLEKIDD